MLRRLAQFCYTRRRLVVVAWIVFLVGLSVLASSFGGTTKTEFEIPNSDSQAAIDLLKARGFDSRGGIQGTVVFTSRAGVDRPEVEAQMEDLFAAIERRVDDVEVVSPYEDGNERQVSANGRVAYAEVNFTDRPQEDYLDAGTTVRGLAEQVDQPGLRVELGGDVFREDLEFSSELIGLACAAIILLLAFGSLLAMGLPLLTAVFGIGCGIALVQLTARVLDMPDFTTQAAAMIGLGVGIDYALFIVTRYRQGLHDGLTPERATVRAIDTAGRAVLFAGTTVVIALLGMFTTGLQVMRGVATGSVLAVLMTMAASITLLPAVLGFVGLNIDRLGLPGRRHAEGEIRQSLWYRWSRVVQRRPWPALVAGAAVLILMTVPNLDMRLGFSDTGNNPTSDTTRRAYDLLSDGFGPGFNGPLLLAADTPDERALDALDDLRLALEDTRGVAAVSPVISNSAGDAAILTVFPTTEPQAAETQELLERVRAEATSDAVIDAGADIHVGGLTAAADDFAALTAERLPVFIAVVLVLSFLLLMVVFRSLLVPLKAVIMNLLSIGASYGLLVAVFQWGWAADLIGIGKEGPIDAWAPLMLFAVVFGLSMDYEVFLLSRIREEYDRTGDNATAVADGLAATARVITAAALIMVCVFGAFVLSDDRALKLFGLGLATAVFVDATIVRVVLVPATMELLGDRNWWLPAWLDRILPVVHVEPIDDVDAELEEIAAEAATPTH